MSKRKNTKASSKENSLKENDLPQEDNLLSENDLLKEQDLYDSSDEFYNNNPNNDLDNSYQDNSTNEIFENDLPEIDNNVGDEYSAKKSYQDNIDAELPVENHNLENEYLDNNPSQYNFDDHEHFENYDDHKFTDNEKMIDDSDQFYGDQNNNYSYGNDTNIVDSDNDTNLTPSSAIKDNLNKASLLEKLDNFKSDLQNKSPKAIGVVAAIGCAVILLLYNIFSSDEPKQTNKIVSNAVKPPKIDDTALEPSAPTLPDLPKLVAPTPTEPAPIIAAAPPAPTTPNPALMAPAPILDNVSFGKDKAKKEAIAKSSMSLRDGNSSGAIQEAGGGELLERTPNQVKATTVGNLSQIIGEGKVIDVVLETAVNTDLPGLTRALVTRDVYAETGKTILIPKGSRVIGQYTSSVSFGQSRIQITWHRLIRPDGVDIKIDSPSTDKLGRSGIEANFDDKFAATVGNAAMVSLINVGFGKLQDKLGVPKNNNTQVQTTPTTTQTATSGGTTTPTTNTTAASTIAGVISGQTTAPTSYNITQDNSNQYQAALKQAANDMNQTLKDEISKYDATSPTATIEQGTKVVIFVKKDLIFPAKLTTSHKVLQ